MLGMFNRCSNLKNIDLSSFDTKKVTNMIIMYAECSNFKEIKINKNLGEKIKKEINEEVINIKYID